jgi:ubiquitin-like 1-activating enzyme E1 B
LFEEKGIAGNIVHAISTTNAIIVGLILIKTTKFLRNDSKNYRMTQFLQHPSRKMLMNPVEPFEPNISCYVCSKTPLSLEVNTQHAKLKDIMEKSVKANMSVNSPLIMHGSTLFL